MLHLTYSPIYSEGISAKARFPRDRYKLVREALEPARQEGRIAIQPPRPATPEELLRVHTADYVQAFVEGRLSETEQRRIGLRPWRPEFVERVLLLTGGTLAALERLSQGASAAGNLAGGTHHAFADRGGGYCVFNDIALAARAALELHGFQRVLVVDLDVHQGDGTASIFEGDPRVFTLSLHGQKNFPSRKQRSDLDVPLADGTGDADYLARLAPVLDDVFDIQRPDLVIYQAGVDGLAEDKLGRLSLTRDGLSQRNALVYERARAAGSKTLITMGGGYGDPLAASAAAHADVFLQAASYL